MTEPADATVPDVLGLTLDEATADLAAHGFRARVEETRPPGAGPGAGAARVIRQRVARDEVVLTVTHERYPLAAGRAHRGRPGSS